MGSLRAGDGLTLAYHRKGVGPVLVCHPGGPGASSAYLGDLGGLSRGSAVVLLDRRGTGRSGSPHDPTAFTLDHYVCDLEELRVHLGSERINLLGFSHGGMVAIRYAATHPQAVERLILVSTSARRGEAQRAEAERLIAARAAEPWYAQAVVAVEAEEDAYESAEAMTRVLKTTAPLYFSRWDAAASEFAERAFGIDCAEALRLFNADPPDLTDDLGRISAPTLVIAGEDDFLCGPASAHEIADGREQSAGADP